MNLFKKKYKRIVYGVGINDADYAVQQWKTIGYRADGRQIQELIWECPYYTRWKSIVGRCCSEHIKQKQPAYKDCSICEEWLIFSNFKMWMERQDWEGKHIDKDILGGGCKIYSPETCCFVPPSVNMFLTDRKNRRGQYLLGVGITAEGKYRSRISINGQEKFLGVFNTEREAHEAWLSAKLLAAKDLAQEIDDIVISTALISRYEKLLENFKNA